MRVHRQGERSRAAAASQCPQKLTQFGEAGAAAPQIGRHGGGEDAVFFQVGVVLGDERILGVVRGSARRESWREAARDGDQVARLDAP
jgi:hypothetical protein